MMLDDQTLAIFLCTFAYIFAWHLIARLSRPKKVVVCVTCLGEIPVCFATPDEYQLMCLHHAALYNKINELEEAVLGS